jgi:integrase
MGSIRRLANGSYQARYRDPDNRVRGKSFKRRRDAARFLAAAETDKSRGQWIDPRNSRISFGQQAQAFVDGARDWRPTTLARAESLIGYRILPTFENAPLGSIRRSHIQAWVSQLEADALSASTIAGCYRLLAQIMASAVADELIAKSPCRDIRLPEAARNEMLFLSPDELARVAAETGRYETLVLCAGYLGLRWGELAGLRRARYNPLRRTIEVVEILVEVRGEMIAGEPKTKASRRTVPVPDFLVGRLNAYLVKRGNPSPEEWVFVGRDGAPLRDANFRRRVWKPAVERAGLPSALRFHDLRHTCVAFLIAAGHDAYRVSRHMGHASIKTTFDRYGHLFAGADDDRLRAGMDRLYKLKAMGQPSRES